MVVHITLNTTLQRQVGSKLTSNLDLQIPVVSTLQSLFDQLDIRFLENVLILLMNRRTADHSQKLRDGAQVDLILATSGD